MSILALMNSSTNISFLSFTDQAFNVANLIVDVVLFPIMFFIVMFIKLFGLWLLVKQGCSVILIGLMGIPFIFSHLIFDIVPGGNT